MPPLSTHAAPGQALGYFFQLERALSWLAKAPAGSFIGIETEDDVVVKLANQESIYEQDKSSTTTHPFLPSRKDLWKTLLIWINAVNDSEIELESSYFFLVTNKPAGKDSLGVLLSAAKKDEEINNALTTLKEKGAQTTGEVKKIVDQLFAFPDTLLCELIKRINFQSGDTLFGEGLKKKLESDLQLDMETSEQNSAIINQLVGWVFGQTVSCWRSKKSAFIERDAFHREKINIITSYRQSVIDELIVKMGEIPENEERTQWSNKYVKQLQLINCTQEDIHYAIHHYLNSVAKRTFLARKGYLTEKQLEELDRNLADHWRNIFRSRKLSLKSLTPKEIGQVIYFDTTGYDTQVGKYVLKSHFITKGSFHSLANRLTIGWHPEYQSHLKEKPQEILIEKEDA